MCVCVVLGLVIGSSSSSSSSSSNNNNNNNNNNIHFNYVCVRRDRVCVTKFILYWLCIWCLFRLAYWASCVNTLNVPCYKVARIAAKY